MPANCSATFEDGKWVCEHRRTAVANMVRFRWVTEGEGVTWQNIGNAPTDHIALRRGSKGFVAINRTASNATTTYTTSMPEGVYCDITKYDFLPASGQCVTPGTTTDAPTGDLITVNSSGQIVNKTLASMDAFAIHVGAAMNTDYGSLANSYGLPWHTQVAGQPILGAVWRADDGVTRGAWSVSTGVVNLTVNGATGYVTGWFDWNQDGDFTDSGEQAFANEQVTAGQTKTVSFTAGTSVYDKTIKARFRVYPTAQTALALAAAAAPQAAPEPTGGATGGEVEDYSWYFSPLAVTLASLAAEPTADGVLVTWETVSETDNLGFNLYRSVSPAGPWAQLNAALIPSLAPGAGSGHRYQWTDDTVVAGTTYWYQIEAMDLWGERTVLGLTSVITGQPAFSRRLYLPLVQR